MRARTFFEIDDLDAIVPECAKKQSVPRQIDREMIDPALDAWQRNCLRETQRFAADILRAGTGRANNQRSSANNQVQ